MTDQAKQRWTVDDVLDLVPNWSRSYLEDLWDGRKSLGVPEVAALDIVQANRLRILLSRGPHVAGAMERIIARAVQSHDFVDRAGRPATRASLARSEAAVAALEKAEAAEWSAADAEEARATAWAIEGELQIADCVAADAEVGTH